MSAVYRIEDKKCATCRWWNGERGIEFRANKPFYVKVGNSSSTCMAKSNGPLPLTQAEKEEKGERLAYEAVFIGRTLKHWDELENLREEGQFDRAHIVHILYGDLGLPDNAGNEQINATINEKLEMDDINVSLAINGLMNSSGETFEACRDAVEKGLQLPNAPYIVNASPSIDKVSGAEGAREDMVTDLARADGSHRVSDGAPLLAGEDVRFVVNFMCQKPCIS